MKPRLTLSINNPCSEKYKNFTPTKSGGFCDSCQKEVVDFTKMTDEEILDYFKNPQSKTCGHFYESQLKMYSEPTPKKWNFNFFGAGLISFSLLSLLPTQSQAQDDKQETVQPVETKTDDSEEMQTSDTIIVSGTVISDIDNEPIIGAYISVQGTNNGTVTDIDGNYSITVKANDVLRFGFIGMQTTTIPVKGVKKIDVTMEEDFHCLSIGEVNIHKPYQAKRSFWQKFKGIFQS